MYLATVATTLAIATGASALIATAVSLPFTPARFWTWRLRKHMTTVGALGDDERYANQSEVLKRRGDYIASKAAAATHIPTDWRRFRHALVQGSFAVGLVVTYAITLIFTDRRLVDLDPLAIGRWGWIVVPPLLFIWGTEVWFLAVSFAETKHHRAKFIRRGCPPDYPVPPTYWAQRLRIAQAEFDPSDPIRRVHDRSRRLRDTGTMPDAWKPRNRPAAMRRKWAAWRREHPWYLGGFVRDPAMSKAVAARFFRASSRATP